MSEPLKNNHDSNGIIEDDCGSERIEHRALVQTDVLIMLANALRMSLVQRLRDLPLEDGRYLVRFYEAGCAPLDDLIQRGLHHVYPEYPSDNTDTHHRWIDPVTTQDLLNDLRDPDYGGHRLSGESGTYLIDLDEDDGPTTVRDFTPFLAA
ncbi:hypothetical protein GF380_03800 [Candidatus Uhrbacteria bacterium]|nr:hypothetical protein [Candidatus Uhrbacteria bacterium]MBD3284219.1 hypothetical protein [Candidatus Uhrbacteria bacterium]